MQQAGSENRRVRPLLAFVLSAFALIGMSAAQAGDLRAVSGLVTPESVVATADGQVYVTEVGAFGKDGDGQVSRIDASGNRQVFATGLNDPKGIVAAGDHFYVADVTRVVGIDAHGKVTVLAEAGAFPQPPLFLNDVALDNQGNLFVSDSGDVRNPGKGAIFQITPQGKVSLVIAEADNAAIRSPNGVLLDPHGHLLIGDFATGELLRLDLKSKAVTKLADGLGATDGLALDRDGWLYISDWKGGQVWKLNLAEAGARPQRYGQTFQAAADISLSPDQKFILVPDMKAGTLSWLPK